MNTLINLNESWENITKDYQVSNYGRVKSLNYLRTGKERILINNKTKNGYYNISLRIDGISKTFYVHRLVWEAFNGPIPDGMQINHIDEDKSNNRLDNLNLMTCKENINWGSHNEKVAQTMIGRKLPYEVVEKVRIANTNGKCSKPVFQYDLEGNFIKEWPSANEITRALGFSQGHISECCRGERKTAHKYKWKYKE